jgi:hypothetical protein
MLQRKKRRNGSVRTDDKMRCFLAAWAAVLTLLVFVAYFQTGDIRVLAGGTTLVGVVVTIVYLYYFPRKRGP